MRLGNFMSFDLKIEGGDIKIEPDGSLSTVIDNYKLRQDIVKILLTKLGENKFHPNYGSEVGAIKIGYISDQELLEIDLKASVEEAVRKIMSLQKGQTLRQYVTPGERIISILNVSAERDNVDPRLYSMFITVQTGALTTITESVTVRIA
jgi:phage baseplate assembly protein W